MTVGEITGIVSAVVGLTAFIVSRVVTRRVRVRVHRAAFTDGRVYGQECYFVNVTNVSLSREVEITHVWFACTPEVYLLPSERPLPKRLKVDETWSTWVKVSDLPTGLTDDASVATQNRPLVAT